ncbi:hypothetical protein EDD15DRAFT_2198190 [Pisolithus albus]|nr:hypothetical protein EDD15DRAFT_2198190 [Pisolithus albus]
MAHSSDPSNTGNLIEDAIQSLDVTVSIVDLAVASQTPLTSPNVHPTSPPFSPAQHLQASICTSCPCNVRIQTVVDEILLSGLTTYKLATYANKPSQIDAVAAAKYGWMNGRKDRLVCGICIVSWALAGRNGMAGEAADVIVEKQRAPFPEMHKEDKAMRWCASLCTARYRARELGMTAIAPDSIVSKITKKNIPLYAALNTFLASSQLSPLRLGQQLVYRLLLLETLLPCKSTRARPERPSSSPFWLASLVGISFKIVRSLYGFLCVRAFLTGALAFVHGQGENAYTDGGPRHPGLATVTRAGEDTTSEEQQQQHVPSSSTSGKSVSLFASSMSISGSQFRRPFDVLKVHRSYYPYVVRSTVVSSLPSATAIVTLNISDEGGGLVEGRRAMWTVIQRHNEGTDGGQDEELEGVQATVGGMKSKGGRDLLKYIGGLLGILHIGGNDISLTVKKLSKDGTHPKSPRKWLPVRSRPCIAKGSSPTAAWTSVRLPCSGFARSLDRVVMAVYSCTKVSAFATSTLSPWSEHAVKAAKIERHGSYPGTVISSALHQ